jgi:hypothetical protein
MYCCQSMQSASPPPLDPFPQQPLQNGRIPAGRISAIGRAIAGLYPLPNRSAPGQNYVASPAVRDREDHFDVRLDHNLGPSDDLAVRYSFADAVYEPFSARHSPRSRFSAPMSCADNATASEAHIFTPIC